MKLKDYVNENFASQTEFAKFLSEGWGLEKPLTKQTINRWIKRYDVQVIGGYLYFKSLRYDKLPDPPDDVI